MRSRPSCWRRLLAISLLVFGMASCDTSYTDGTVVAGLTSQDELLVGELHCDSQTMKVPEEAIIWRVTGNPNERLTLLWRGHRAKTTPLLVPSSGLNLFEAYEFVEGPLGPVTGLRSVANATELFVVLVSNGGGDILMSSARAHTGEYSTFRGQTGTFDELQRAHCAPSVT